MTPEARAIAASAVVVAAIVAGVVTLGSPTMQRHRRLDERRVADLRNLESAVTVYWHRRQSLPPDLDALSKEPGLRPNTHDPETGTPYDYELIAADSYRLCAVFAFDSAANPATRDSAAASNWAHGAGRHCFDLRIPQKE
jgi:hypothetical protein